MVLVLNLLLNTRIVKSFDAAIEKPLKKSGSAFEIIKIKELSKPLDASKYTHLILSGSEATIVEDYSWDDAIAGTIINFIDAGKPVLGICYGHQFIVRAVLGKKHVRRAERPEFGWAKINTKNNKLFKGVEDLISMVSHYDEVCDLPPDFKVIASTSFCEVHAFQYRDLPVWGTQFHPEYRLKEANEIFDLVRTVDPQSSRYFTNQMQAEQDLEQNEKILINFLEI